MYLRFLTRSNTNQPAHLQKIVRCSKFWLFDLERPACAVVYLFCTFDFACAKSKSSHDAAQIVWTIEDKIRAILSSPLQDTPGMGILWSKCVLIEE